MEKPLVIVAHASVGSGHRSAANAVAQALAALRDSPKEAAQLGATAPENLEVEVIDMLDFGRIRFDGDKTATLFTGAARPLYDITWRYNFTGRMLWGGGTSWSRLMFPQFTAYVQKRRPLAVVCTHITAANVAVGARMISHLNFPIICVPTDYEIEGMWPHLHTDLFCVANEHMAETLRARRVADERILITGLPTRLSFREQPDPLQARTQFALPTEKRIAVVLAGAYLSQPYVLFRETLDATFAHLGSIDNLHVVIVAGCDSAYAKHLRTLRERHDLDNVTIFEYVEDVAALMAASDVAVCKAGGLTVTECLCAKTPMILVGKTYGQEKANMRMLTAAGAALHVTTARELIEALAHITAHPAHAQAMLTNAAFLSKPHAATDIAIATLKLAARNFTENATLEKKRFLQIYWGDKPAHTR